MMICTVKQPSISIIGSDVVLRKNGLTLTPVQSLPLVLPSMPGEKAQRSLVSVKKPLHLSCVGVGNFVGSVRRERSDFVTCGAYEADRSEVEGAGAATPEAAKKVKIGIYFATWWALNVVFNIYNKKVLNA